MPNWAQNGPKWSKTCYIDHLGSFWALLDRFGTSASLPCSAIFGPKRAIMIRGSQKGGVGSDVWEKFPNNIVFFFESLPKLMLFLDFSDLVEGIFCPGMCCSAPPRKRFVSPLCTILCHFVLLCTSLCRHFLLLCATLYSLSMFILSPPFRP